MIEEEKSQQLDTIAKFLFQRFPNFTTDCISSNMTVADMVTELLTNKPLPTEGEIDPSWRPISGDELEGFERFLDETLLMLSNRRNLVELRKEIMALRGAKSKSYQDNKGVDSCYKRAFGGVYHNLARKWDRIEAVGIRFGLDRADEHAAEEAEAEGYGDPETLYVTFRDMAIYCILGMRFIAAMSKKSV